MARVQGSLYIVSTPIGNLDDITYRAVEILNKVDICASEDTRVSKKLFNKYNIKTKLISYHKFSERSKINSLINHLLSGRNLALISDAGTPLISDPGQYLVEAAIENEIKVIPVPGPTSVISALSVSGFNLEKFTFYGFFPRKEKDKKRIVQIKENLKQAALNQEWQKLSEQQKLEIVEFRKHMLQLEKEKFKNKTYDDPWFRQTKSKINKTLRDNLSHPEYQFCMITRVGPSNDAKHGLSLQKDSISINQR